VSIYFFIYLFIHFVTHIKYIHLHRDITITITRKCCDRRRKQKLNGAWEIGLSVEFLIIGDDYVIVVTVEVACGIGVSRRRKVLVKGDINKVVFDFV
jgi:hypothetical protein